MIPRWKVKREWRRVQTQLAAVASSPYVRVRNAKYDLTKRTLFKFSDGEISWKKNCAILLVFQPNGLLKSTIETCKYLNETGFSVFVVSNTSLTSQDRETLVRECSLVLERPNIGYDFGGYRDGILHLIDSGRTFENLMILNDSIWFPAVKSTSLVRDLLELDGDIVGPMLQTHGRKPEKDHLQSYMVMFRQKVSASPEFERYWRKFQMPLNRYQAIQEGEMRLTNTMAGFGFSISALHNSTDIRNHLKGMSDEALSSVLPYMKWKNKTAGLNASNLDRTKSDWRQKVEQLIDHDLRQFSPLDTHPMLLLEVMGVPYLKKDKNIPYQVQRDLLLESNLKDTLQPSVLEEVMRWSTAPKHV